MIYSFFIFGNIYFSSFLYIFIDNNIRCQPVFFGFYSCFTQNITLTLFRIILIPQVLRHKSVTKASQIICAVKSFYEFFMNSHPGNSHSAMIRKSVESLLTITKSFTKSLNHTETKV